MELVVVDSGWWPVSFSENLKFAKIPTLPQNGYWSCGHPIIVSKRPSYTPDKAKLSGTE